MVTLFRLTDQSVLQAFSVQGCVLTIGNFDGVHLGHQAVINKLAQQGKQMGLPVVVMLFEPQPLEYFSPSTAPARLSKLREKIYRLAKLPVDYICIIKFNGAMANYDAKDFIKQILVEAFRVKYLVIGDDFRFGNGRQGDFALLKRQGVHYGFNVDDTGSLLINGQRVSSTLIRQALASGDMSAAKNLLGYAYSICGRVTHGHKRGRTIGYPTANIRLARVNVPISGVFAVIVDVTGRSIKGVANIGVRPTVNGGDAVVLEVYLFDFDSDLYGVHVTVQFIEKIRAEQRFVSLEALKTRIKDDVAAAHKIFALRHDNNGLQTHA
jgi:riboflavin kinase / FMN adenylyltransferase